MNKPRRLRFASAANDLLPDHDVFLLGAGFSWAISARMPLMTGLTKQVLAALPHDASKESGAELVGFNSNFEQALSYLSESQPWLDESDRLRNRALFLDLTDSIHRVIVRAQSEAVKESPVCPDWLSHLVLWMQRKRASIVTLNYDTLLESAFLELSTPEHLELNSWDFRSFTVLPSATYLGFPMDPGVRLFKLHGSVHWTYSGTDHYYGESLRDGSVNRWSRAPNDHTPFAVDEGRVPLIVPPTFNKNRYFENEKIRHMWRRAWLALAGARRIFCIGYGLPEGDLLMQSLLRDAGRVRDSQVSFYIVDRSRDVAQRYRQVLPSLFEVNDTYVADRNDVTESFVRALLGGELDSQDGHKVTTVVHIIRSKIQEECVRNVTKQNIVTGVPFLTGRLDEYGIVLSASQRPGTRYVVWEVLGDLLKQIQSGDFNKYLMPDAGYPVRIPFSGDAMLFSLLRLAGFVVDVVENNQLKFSVSSEVLQ